MYNVYTLCLEDEMSARRDVEIDASLLLLMFLFLPYHVFFNVLSSGQRCMIILILKKNKNRDAKHHENIVTNIH